MRDKSLTIIAIGLVCAVLFPQIGACVKYHDRKAAESDAVQQAKGIEHWNANVEPMKQVCLQRGGIPKIVDTPNTGAYDWQVECQYPPTGVVVTNHTISWIHNDKSPEAELVRQNLRALGWECCQQR